MSNFTTPRAADEDSASSDDKMDTASESFPSQDTPDSDTSGENVLRLQNPEKTVLRLSQPEVNDNIRRENLTYSFVTKMSGLTIDSPANVSLELPSNKLIGISPPRVSNLVSATSHPLMGLLSPDEYPDLIPKKVTEDEKESYSSVEESYDFYSPERNTSKNNLYFSENFGAEHDSLPPDVARVEKEKRIVMPRFLEKNGMETPQRLVHLTDSSIKGANGVLYMKKPINGHSTPKLGSESIDIPQTEFCSGVEWCESPSHLRSIPNFDLPIELSSNITDNNNLDSPDVISSSTQDSLSLYSALLDPHTGRVALRPSARHQAQAQGPTRRRIELPPEEEDACSVGSACESLESEDEPEDPKPSKPDQGDDAGGGDQVDGMGDKSRSSSTCSCSERIPEYSLAEELAEERGWLRVGAGPQGVCDMRVIEPYKRVLSHGGYDAGGAAVIVLSACHLPPVARPDYTYVMDNLFLYVMWSLERLVVSEYALVYLHSGCRGRRMPTFGWLHHCYRLVGRRLRKSLKHLYLVHPTFWLKSFVMITKPFVSSKFFKKLSYVRSLSELYELVPVEPNSIPEAVKEYDANK